MQGSAAWLWDRTQRSYHNHGILGLINPAYLPCHFLSRNGKGLSQVPQPGFFSSSWRRAKPRTLSRLFHSFFHYMVAAIWTIPLSNSSQNWASDKLHENYPSGLSMNYFFYLFGCRFLGFSSPRIAWTIHSMSSVFSMVAPTWCHGPNWGNPFGRMLTELTSELTIL